MSVDKPIIATSWLTSSKMVVANFIGVLVWVIGVAGVAWNGHWGFLGEAWSLFWGLIVSFAERVILDF